MKFYLINLLIVVFVLKFCISAKSGLYEQGQNNHEEVQNETESNKKISSSTESGNDNNNNDKNNENENLNNLRKKHDYKLSFKKPYYYYNDTNIVPNWEISGDTIPSENMIRLAPSIPNKKGSIWSNIPNAYKEWQVYLKLQISGRGVKGSQGMALFYSKDKLKNDQFYGSENIWNGLAIIFDSINVDDYSHMPIISVLYNDGNTLIKTKSDYISISKGVCVGDFRNSPDPVHVRITYRERTLIIEADLSHHGNEFYECTVLENFDIPQNYYFGLSAKTGSSFADDHDIISFDFYELNPEIKERYIRPLEEEVIQEEGEYKLDDETMKHIKEIENIIEKEEDDPEDDIPHNINAYTVYESQYKILDIVNRIFSYLKTAPPVTKNDNNEGSSSKITSELENTKKELESTKIELEKMRNELANINSEISKLKFTIGESSQKVENKLFSSKDEMRALNTNINSSNRRLQDEMKRLHEENRQILELNKNQPNIWLIVSVVVALNAIVVYIIIRVLPNNNSDPFKTHNY